MKRTWLWCVFVGCLLALLCPLAKAQDDDDEGGNTLDPNLQWRLGCAAWDRREYDDAAAIYVAYADKNPDEENALDAWWRSYEIFRAYRPNETKRKATYEKAMAACERWQKKYPTSNANRAAAGLWYQGNLYNNEGNRPLGIGALTQLVKKYPGTNLEANAYWTLGEWLRELNRYAEAAPNYAGYRKLAGVSEQSAMAAFREGWCYEATGDKESAIQAYKVVLESNYNWQWYQVYWGGIDAARRLKKLGEPELARRFLVKIIDSCPQDWDVTKQAYAELGEKPAMKMWLHPHLYYYYDTDLVNIDSRSKMDLSLQLNMLVRSRYIDKEKPFKGTLLLTPLVDMTTVPTTMQPADGEGGKKGFQVDVTATTDADTWYNFVRATQKVEPPDNLVITRKWEKMGNTWGEFTLRIQAAGRWHMWVYMPNTKTNPNNLSMQPNEIHENGKTFRWYDWYDLTQGMTIKFPIEVGGNVAQYYPKIRLERWWGPGYPEKSGNGTEATFDMKEMKVKLTSAAAFPFTINTPTYTQVILEEVTK